MEKCRICLGNKKDLRNIFDSVKNTCYAEMIQAIAKIKISRDTDIAPNLCRLCCKKLVEAYELKLEIKRADSTLNQFSNCKRLHFDHFNEMKIEIEIQADCKPSIEKITNVTKVFAVGTDEMTYGSTYIKKVPSSHIRDVCLKPVPVLDFLRTIKDEDGDDFINYNADSDDNFNDDDIYGADNDLDDPEDGDYIPPQKLFKQGRPRNRCKATKLQTGKENKNSHQNKQFVCIKPVNLKGLRLVYNTKKKSNGKVKKTSKMEMCPHCGIMTKTLKIHVLKHTGEKKFKCGNECGKSFYSKTALRAHMKNVHATIKNFKCDQCIAAFPSFEALKSHKIMHSSEMKYVCEICNKPFKRSATYKRHTKMHNSANKSIKCEQCNMSFFTPHMLRHHMRVHTGERPFNCEICSQPYSYKHDFNRHCLKKHGVFLKRRNVRVMNKEVLQREKQLLRDLVLRLHGVSKDDQPQNPFEHEGPGAAMAFHLVMKAIEAKLIPIDLQL